MNLKFGFANFEEDLYKFNNEFFHVQTNSRKNILIEDEKKEKS